ncbi:hypothetical protein VTK26DRAFT_5003 [Humicola hyalothermophila]
MGADFNPFFICTRGEWWPPDLVLVKQQVRPRFSMGSTAAALRLAGACRVDNCYRGQNSALCNYIKAPSCIPMYRAPLLEDPRRAMRTPGATARGMDAGRKGCIFVPHQSQLSTFWTDREPRVETEPDEQKDYFHRFPACLRRQGSVDPRKSGFETVNQGQSTIAQRLGHFCKPWSTRDLIRK